jgi:hypothetical protein
MAGFIRRRPLGYGGQGSQEKRLSVQTIILNPDFCLLNLSLLGIVGVMQQGGPLAWVIHFTEAVQAARVSQSSKDIQERLKLTKSHLKPPPRLPRRRHHTMNIYLHVKPVKENIPGL